MTTTPAGAKGTALARRQGNVRQCVSLERLEKALDAAREAVRVDAAAAPILERLAREYARAAAGPGA
ncbi:MAG: hypothetical protein AAFR84_06520 [Pseudomonadota bacterium]